MVQKMLTDILETQCREAVSLVPLFFSINSGQVYTQSDLPLRTILYHILTQIAQVNSSLHLLATADGKAAVVSAIYDANTLPLVDGHVARVVELLDPKEKARLLAEGIASCMSFSARLLQLGAHTDITLDVLQQELGRFATSSQLSRIRHTIEHSPLFSNCLMISQIMDLIMEASSDDSLAGPAKCASYHDYDADVFSLGYERPSRNMGLPWGFTFMVLN